MSQKRAGLPTCIALITLMCFAVCIRVMVNGPASVATNPPPTKTAPAVALLRKDSFSYQPSSPPPSSPPAPPLPNLTGPPKYRAQFGMKQQQCTGCPWDQLTKAETLGSCKKIFEDILVNIAAPAVWPPPRHVPSELASAFTLDSTIAVGDYYLAQRYDGGSTELVWTEQVIEDYLANVRANDYSGSSLRFGYNEDPRNLYIALLALQQSNSLGKRAVVFGSETPWIEALLVSMGVAEVVTVEYQTIKSSHPKIKWLHPSKFAEQARDGTLQPFDLAVSFSSLEHSGLGRYGDRVDPFGDVSFMQSILCTLKPTGHSVIGLPMSHNDVIHWNAHRVYGPHRLPFLTAGFKVTKMIRGGNSWPEQSVNDVLPSDDSGGTQPVLTLQPLP